MNIWQKLKKPILIQAPMEDVTDTVFRQIIGSVGAPDLYFTEFTNADGIIRGGSGYISQRLQFDKKLEKPIIAQIWGKNPEHYFKSAQLLSKMGYDGIDINMGCPDRKVIKNGCCSALIKNHALAKELFEAAAQGAQSAGGRIPISIKTRIGFSEIQINEWIGFLLSLQPAALTVHLRTVKEMSKVPAHWDEMEKVVQLKNAVSPETIIIGNGDVESYKQAIDYISKYKCDGVMIGRGMIHNPWVFNSEINVENLTIQDRLTLLQKHIELFSTTWGNKKNFDLMKKFYKAYINGFDGAAEMRQELFMLKEPEETISKIQTLLSE